MAESRIYTERGVSSSKEEIHQAIKRNDPGIFPGAFCKILPDSLTNDPDHCLVMHADGAGTKSSLAYVYWKETGDLSVFKGIAIDSMVMNIDDLACVGAVDRFLFSNTIGRNKFFIPGEVIQTIIDGFNEFIDQMSGYGVQIDFCGGETADVGDVVRTLIVDSTLTARMKRSEVVDLSNVQSDDVIVGFASFGQAIWEPTYNSGIGSNGLTAARHDCFDKVYAKKYPESFAPEIPENMVYCGSGKLTDPLEGTPLNLGQAVLSPTRTYTPLIQKALNQFSGEIHGMVHCTGGGQTKCLKFGNQIHYIKDNLYPLPPIFSYIQQSGGYTTEELLPVFNMGHRLEIFCPGGVSGELISMAAEFGIDARIVGRCKKSETQENQLTITVDDQTITY